MPLHFEARYYSSIRVSRDRAWYAAHNISDGIGQLDFMRLHELQRIDSIINIVDIESGNRQKLRINMLMAPGSGVVATFNDPLLGFDSSGRLIVRAESRSGVHPELHGAGRSVFAYDPRNGTREELSENPEEFLRLEPSSLRFIPAVPQELELLLEGESRSEAAVATAFLKAKGLPIEYTDMHLCRVEFSADQSRFVLKSSKNEMNRVFFIGDLESGTLLKIPSPAPLVHANDINIRILDH
jgi:hypothetical protein